ncbi:TetR/AcrR family transcriptional regulator [Leifsonia naganoensis]|uniref:AcrR family transcriptional regulator n=1 Tax=Leifsonia naganoensis TaxID=150025 RepID=A0A853DVA7_9MICO|nr:TetR/AcrR family transcriptional regulator [Leifsonia naganoensis]NYK10110.1 AcrR family transcriptional regulator [Leifsonia naganoensis]
MTPASAARETRDERAADAPAARARDAVSTRRHLLAAARRRFALDGYSATTVREIAADAGVNVALINRYFGSKEGLFEACLTLAVEGLEASERPVPRIQTLVHDVARQVSEPLSSEDSMRMLLLLRSSGDPATERIRRGTFQRFAERMATAAGWSAGDPATEHLMLRAEIAMATTFGIVLLRASSGLEPLMSASADDLRGPLAEVLNALLDA